MEDPCDMSDHITELLRKWASERKGISRFTSPNVATTVYNGLNEVSVHNERHSDFCSAIHLAPSVLLPAGTLPASWIGMRADPITVRLSTPGSLVADFTRKPSEPFEPHSFTMIE